MKLENQLDDYTDLELQIAICKEFPELIEPFIDYNQIDFTVICWRDSSKPVNFREWEWIMREIENRLPDNLVTIYKANLIKTNPFADFWQYSWQARAVAYFKTIKKEIKNIKFYES